MVRLIIVRHAKTEWNKAGRIQGRSDIPLASESIIATKAASFEYAKYDISACYSSPLSRAVKTAQLLLGNRNIQVKTDARLIERDFGFYDGKTYEELKMADHDKLFYDLSEDPSAETEQSVFDRMKSFLLDMAKLHCGHSVLVVSHGVAISFLLYAATHSEFNAQDYKMSYIKNLTATEVVLEDA